MIPFLLFLHFTGLAMGVGTSLSMRFVTPAAMQAPERGNDKLLNSMANQALYGLILLLVSGIILVMVQPFYVSVGGTLFKFKLVLVALLIIALLVARYFIKGYLKTGDKKTLVKAKPFAMTGMVTGVAIILLACLAFS